MAKKAQQQMQGDGFPPPVPPVVEAAKNAYVATGKAETEAKKQRAEARDALIEAMEAHGIERVPLGDGSGVDFVLEHPGKIVKQKREGADRTAENASD